MTLHHTPEEYAASAVDAERMNLWHLAAANWRLATLAASMTPNGGAQRARSNNQPMETHNV